MALAKRVKVGGAYYRGDVCIVSSAGGDYAKVITNTSAAAINGVSVTPDMYGPLDTWKLVHYNDPAGTGQVLAIIAESINNVGAGSTITLDFPAAELINNGECMKFIYTNTASVAGNVYLVSEFMGIKKVN